MNIIDIKKEEIEKALQDINAKDTFDLLLKIGKEYSKEYDTSKIDINTREGQKEFRRIAWYVVEELSEMINILKTREWTESEYQIDELHFAEEWADFMNFVMQLIILLDWDDEKIQDIIVRKFLINKFRKASKY